LPGRVVGDAGPLGRVDTANGPVTCVVPDDAPEGSEVVVSIRPEDVTVAQGDGDDGWDATVTQAVFLGECVDCRLAVGDVELRARIHPSVRVRRGDRVRVSFRSDRCVAVRLEASGGTL
jgi:iron(III) transport system ATP-binding protein